MMHGKYRDALLRAAVVFAGMVTLSGCSRGDLYGSFRVDRNTARHATLELARSGIYTFCNQLESRCVKGRFAIISQPDDSDGRIRFYGADFERYITDLETDSFGREPYRQYPNEFVELPYSTGIIFSTIIYAEPEMGVWFEKV